MLSHWLFWLPPRHPYSSWAGHTCPIPAWWAGSKSARFPGAWNSTWHKTGIQQTVVLYFPAVLGIESRASHMPGRPCTMELHQGLLRLALNLGFFCLSLPSSWVCRCVLPHLGNTSLSELFCLSMEDYELTFLWQEMIFMGAHVALRTQWRERTALCLMG